MVYEAAVQISGVLAALAAVAVVLANYSKVKLPNRLAKLANDPEVMERVFRALDYAARFPHLTDDQKREIARRFLREQLSRYLREPLADHAANLLIELALSRRKA